MCLDLSVSVCVLQDKQGKVHKIQAPNLLRGVGQQTWGLVINEEEERKWSINRSLLAGFNTKLSLKRGESLVSHRSRSVMMRPPQRSLGVVQYRVISCQAASQIVYRCNVTSHSLLAVTGVHFQLLHCFGSQTTLCFAGFADNWRRKVLIAGDFKSS